MKTAEQWAMDEHGIYHDEIGELSGYVDKGVNSFIDLVKIIQTDALKWAAEQITTDGNPDVARDKIMRKINDVAALPNVES